MAQVLGGLQIDSFRARDQAEVRGYGELLELIFETHAEIPLTENHVKQLVERTNRALAEGEIPALIGIARFVIEFLAIHPFQDGNGRLSRALTTLLMLHAGYDYVPYTSHERIIEENKPRYYAALRESQLAMREDPSAFGAWTVFFLGALRAQMRALEAKVDVERSMLQLSEVQESILAAVRASGRATTARLRQELGLPDRTLRYHLGLPVGRNLLAAHGERRGRYYTAGAGDAIAPPLGDPGTTAIIAEIYELGGRIGKRALASLVKRHGYNARVVGILHGRRRPHLRRDARTGESVLTARGHEVARQYLFTKRLADGARAGLAGDDDGP